MKRWMQAAGVTAVAAGALAFLSGCGEATGEAAPAPSSTPTNIATPAAPGGEATPAASAPSSSDVGTSTSPTGDPSSSFWTDEKLQQVEPENMPTEH